MKEEKEDTLTPIFPMEQDTDKYIRKIINESFDKSLGINTTIPQEVSNNTMSVVGSVNKPITFFWRPNNYRLQIPFNRDNLNLGVETTLLSDIRKGSVLKTKFGNIKVSNYGTKINFELDGLPIVIDKNSITITYSLRSAISPTKVEKAIYKIEADNIEDIHKRIDERVNLIKETCIKTTKKVIEQYGGKADFDKAIWLRHEDAIHKEDWIPDESIIHDTHFKKVYPTQVEMKSPAFIKNFYSNRVVEEIAPQIAKELNEGNKSIVELRTTIVDLLDPILKDFTKQMSLHLEVQTETKETLKEMRKPFFIRWFNYFRRKK